jgi:hypothetical protein
VFVSTNQGEHWSTINAGLTNQEVNVIITDNANLYAGTNGGAFLSTNRGASWTAKNTGLTNTIVQSFIIHNNNIFAGTGGGGIFLSTNNGTNWTAVNTGLTSTNVVCFTSSGANLFAGTLSGGFSADSGGVYLSTNNGTSWARTCLGLTSNSINALAVISHGADANIFAGAGMQGFFSGIEGTGVFRSSDNGAYWTRVHSGLITEIVRDMLVLDSSIILGIGNVLYRTTDEGTSWTENSMGIADDVITEKFAILPGDPANIFAALDYTHGVVRSTDNGLSWTPVNSGLSGTMKTLITCPNGSGGIDLFAGTRDGVFLSTNKGNSWTGSLDSNVTAIAADTLSRRIFAGTNRGLFSSTNKGASWSLVDTNLTSLSLADTNYVTALAVVHYGINDVRIFAAFDDHGVYRSTNDGKSWDLCNYGLDNNVYTYVNTFLLVGDNLLAGENDGGTYILDSYNLIWQNIGIGLSVDKVNAFAVTKTNLFVGSESDGLWRRPLYEMAITGVGDETETVPIHYVLRQNYPNPFNPTTTISYTLPSRSQVSLKIYDILGREVSNLVNNEILSQGSYSRQWNATGFSSGVYFYRLQTGKFTETKKLLLLK